MFVGRTVQALNNFSVWLLTHEECKHDMFKGLKNTWNFKRLLQASGKTDKGLSVHGSGGN